MLQLQEKFADHVQDQPSTVALNVMERNAQNALMDGIYQPPILYGAPKETHHAPPNSVTYQETLHVVNVPTDTEIC